MKLKQKQVLITIWILGNPECLRSVADRFNITKSILFRVYRRIWSDCQQSFRSIYEVPWNWTPLGKMINFGSFAQRNALDQWSVFRSRRSVIRWILFQSGFDRSLIWKWICSQGTPQIRNPDPNSLKGTHPELLSHVRMVYISRDYLVNHIATSDIVQENEICLSLVISIRKSTDTRNSENAYLHHLESLLRQRL